jgi:hypothetical protein
MQPESIPPGSERLDYLDFELEIGLGTGREYPVSVVRSPAGEAHETMRFPYDEMALGNRLQGLQIALLRSGGARRQISSPEQQVVRELGRDLFDALFAGEARSRYDMSCRDAQQQGKGLRLKLRIQPPELAMLPWEFLYDPRRAEYICLSRDNPIVRYVELPQPIQPLAVAPPLQILGMIANPRDLPALDVAREKQRIETAIQNLGARGLINLTWLEGETWRDLQRAMRGGPWHIFHFIGHGGFDHSADEGMIALADENGSTYCLHATELGRLLADHRSLRIVLLNSCEGARGSERDLFSSTAAILVRRGMSAVLAMQYEITDRAAMEFARAFYESLADGLPVDASVTEARKAVSLAVSNTVEWGTPVLYMRAPQGVIFKMTETPRVPQSLQKLSVGMDKETQRRLEWLYTDGLSAFWVDDWDKACNDLQTLLDECPDYPNAAAKLEEAKRHRRLSMLYAQAKTAQEAGDWQAAQAALETLVAEATDFKDAAALLASVKKQRQIADLYAQAGKLSQAEQWQAVMNVLAEIRTLDASFADPERLLPAAERGVAVLKRQAELENLYRQAVGEMDARRWSEAQRLLATIQKTQPGFRDTERLLLRAEAEVAREEAQRKREAQIATLYEQARELARSRRWRQAAGKMQEIQKLDAQFADPEGIASRAQAAIAQEEREAQQRNELAALYSQAVQLLQAQQYQAALEQWSQIKTRDPHYPDRQNVQSTARKKLHELAKPATPGRRRLSGRVAGILGILSLVVIAGGLVFVSRFVAPSPRQTPATAQAANVAMKPSATSTPIAPQGSSTPSARISADLAAPAVAAAKSTATNTPVPTSIPSATSVQPPIIVAKPTAPFTPVSTQLPDASATPMPADLAAPAIPAEAPTATDTAVPARPLTPTNTPTSTLAPTPTPAPTETRPRPTATIDADPLVYDNFNNRVYDGSYNPNQWGARANTAISQRDGALTMAVTAPNGAMNLNARQYTGVALDKPIFLQAKLRFAPGQSGGFIALRIEGEKAGNFYAWYSTLWGGDYGGGSSCFTNMNTGPNWKETRLGTAAANPQDWHTIRIELDPATMTFVCYIDNQKVYAGVPPDSAVAFKDAKFTLYAVVANNSSSGGGVVGYLDDVRIGPVGK